MASVENTVANDVASLAYFSIVNMVTEGVCYGIYLVVYVAAHYTLRRYGKRSRPFTLLRILLWIIFFLMTGSFAADVALALVPFAYSKTPVDANTPPLADRQKAATFQSIAPALLTDICEYFGFLAGDAVVIWRASALWPRSRFVRFGLYFLLFASTCVALFDFVNLLLAKVRASGEANADKVDSARLFLSFAINLAATLAIGVRAWKLHGSLRVVLHRPSRSEQFISSILALLIECGLIFCIVQLLYGIFALVVQPRATTASHTAPISLFKSAMNPFFTFFAGIYPCLVILVVTREKSVMETATDLSSSLTANGARAPVPAVNINSSRQTGASGMRIAPMQVSEDIPLETQGQFRLDLRGNPLHTQFDRSQSQLDKKEGDKGENFV